MGWPPGAIISFQCVPHTTPRRALTDGLGEVQPYIPPEIQEGAIYVVKEKVQVFSLGVTIFKAADYMLEEDGTATPSSPPSPLPPPGPRPFCDPCQYLFVLVAGCLLQ